VDPVPDPLLLRKSGSAGDRTRDLCICSQKLWPLDHRGGLSYFKMRHYFQNELSNTYAFDINLASHCSSVNDVTSCGLVDRLPCMAKLKNISRSTWSALVLGQTLRLMRIMSSGERLTYGVSQILKLPTHLEPQITLRKRGASVYSQHVFMLWLPSTGASLPLCNFNLRATSD